MNIKFLSRNNLLFLPRVFYCNLWLELKISSVKNFDIFQALKYSTFRYPSSANRERVLRVVRSKLSSTTES